jgi:hypothetical protein
MISCLGDTSRAMSLENVKIVRRLWEAANEGGLEAVVRLTDADVKWAPHQAGGRVLTSAEVLELFERLPRDGVLESATLYSIESHGDSVLASGSFRMREGGALVEFQVHWLYDFGEQGLIQAASYPARVDALAALRRRT